MNEQKKITILENVYASVLAESVYYFGKEGILDKVTESKEKVQMATAKNQISQFGITSPEEVFKTLSEIFNCAKWEVSEKEDGIIAEANNCKLCAFAKRMGAESPCKIYCLNPIKSMVAALDGDYDFKVKKTLYDNDKCCVEVTKK